MLVSVLHAAPPAGDSTAEEFSKILFRLLVHLCTVTALRLISLDKATENGHAAFQRLVKRY